jgi:Tfp pilus assembly protein PilF
MKVFQVFAVSSMLCLFSVAHASAAEVAGPHAAADALMYKASDAITRNDMPAAIHMLRECVSADKSYPKCPRILAILYGKQGDQKKAATYYRVYLKENPKAKDAAAVRDLVREYEAD